jgi:hypothetical protein
MAAIVLAAGGCGGTRLVSGTGGNPTLAGSPGIGGNPGTGGTPGTGGSNVALCDQLGAAYSAVLAGVAAACTPGAPNQCQVLVANTPTTCPSQACGNQQYVNDSTQLELLRGEWVGACSPDPMSSCTGLGCRTPQPPAACVPTSPGASTGICAPYGSDGGTSLAPDGGESCDQLAADYMAIVNAGQGCTPGAPNQCGQSAVLPVNHCDGTCVTYAFMNDRSGTEAALTRWEAQCRTCSPAACIGPSFPMPTGTCAAVDGGGGVCVAGPPAPRRPFDAGMAPPAADASESCDQLAADYAAAVSKAMGCQPGGGNQCQQSAQATVPSASEPCACTSLASVNDSSSLKAPYQKWLDQCAPVCAGFLCPPPLQPGTCVPVDGGGWPPGVCVAP